MSLRSRGAPGLPVGAGVTFHPALAARLLHGPPAFVEFVAEGLTSAAAVKQARAFSEVCPIALHGTGLSLGSADGVDDARVARLAKLVQQTGAVACSEHLSFVRAAGVEIGHLTPLPRTAAAVDVIADNVARASRALPGLLLENVWSPLPAHRVPDDVDEADFLCAVVARTGCGLLLDVANLQANCDNRGVDALALVDRLPLFAVRELHVAGSCTDPDGFVVDTHADPVSEAVFALVAAVLQRTGPLPVCLERDRGLDDDGDVEQVMGELARLQRLVDDAVNEAAPGARVPPTATATATATSTSSASAPAARTALLDWQTGLARALTRDDVECDGAVDADLRRARGILARKRAEHRALARRPTPSQTQARQPPTTSTSTSTKKPFPFSLWSAR